jgi:galactokinase
MKNSKLNKRIKKLKDKFSRDQGISSKQVKVVVSPLRICPLGAHVDHQFGAVTGMALDEVVLLAFVPNDCPQVVLQSANFEGIGKFNLGDTIKKSDLHWENYARGAAEALSTQYDITKGIIGLTEGTMPIGGLSSSAAVGVAYLLALESANGLDVSSRENIELDQYIENQYFGLKNGILDQSMILLGKKDHLTHLDCHSVAFSHISSSKDMPKYEILIAHSGLSKSLTTSSDYNNRVGECQEATELLARHGGLEYQAHMRLRHIPIDIWETHGHKLPDVPRRRAKHFFTENSRVSQGLQLWEAGDLEGFGALITESGESSVHDYESGCPHLTTLFNILKDTPGVHGARFSGAGFRGSCIGLIDPEYKEEIQAALQGAYPEKHPDMAERYSIHFCKSGDGAHVTL